LPSFQRKLESPFFFVIAGGQLDDVSLPVSRPLVSNVVLGGGQNHFAGLWAPPPYLALLRHLLLQIASALEVLLYCRQRLRRPLGKRLLASSAGCRL